MITTKDHLLIEPHELQKATGGYYQVFTPFFNNWRRLIKNRVFTQTPKFSKLDLSIDFSKDMISHYMPKTHVPLPTAGEDAAQETLKTFLLEKIDRALNTAKKAS